CWTLSQSLNKIKAFKNGLKTLATRMDSSIRSKHPVILLYTRTGVSQWHHPAGPPPPPGPPGPYTGGYNNNLPPPYPGAAQSYPSSSYPGEAASYSPSPSTAPQNSDEKPSSQTTTDKKLGSDKKNMLGAAALGLGGGGAL
ncbi:1538_t:CDS:2, partial [Acaulospora morrowiae]